MINLKKSTFLYIFFAMMACSVPVKAQNPATQTITLSDGGRYTGQVLHGKPNGKGKADIVKKAFFGPVTPEVPASILQMHPDCILVADEEALSLL